MHWRSEHDGGLWLWSGYGKAGYLDDLWRMDPPTPRAPPRWQQVHVADVAPVARCWAHSWVVGGKLLYIFSGSGSDGSMLADLWSFNSVTRQWLKLADHAGNAEPVYYGANARPGGRENGYAMADEQRGLLWLYGGDGEHMSPPQVPNCSQALTPWAYLFSGYGANSFGGLDDLWSLDLRGTDSDVLVGATAERSTPTPQWSFRAGTNRSFSPYDTNPWGFSGIAKGVRGKRGVAAKGNVPSAAHAGYAWPCPAGGKLWIMGGEDDQANTNGHGIYSGKPHHHINRHHAALRIYLM